MNADGILDDAGNFHEFQAGEKIDPDKIEQVYSHGGDGSSSVHAKQKFLEYVNNSQGMGLKAVFLFFGLCYAFVHTVFKFALSRYVFQWRKTEDCSLPSFASAFSRTSIGGAAWYGLWNFIWFLPMYALSFFAVWLTHTVREPVSNGSLSAGYVGLMYMVSIYVFLAYIVFACTKIMSYSMMCYVLAENPSLGAVRAMRLSKKMCKGCRENIFVMQLSFFLWWIFTAVTLGFGFILFMPYFQNSFINAYEDIKKNAMESGVLKQEDFDVLQ
ncbi:MAG: DUF975 family protein [Treponema sp.]|nr:DUF975 family protein [Treponema sp.]